MKLPPERETIIRELVERHLARSGAGEALSRERHAALSADMSALTAALLADEAQARGAAGVDFPAFVAELIGGVFEATVDASIEQMEAYADLVAAAAADLAGATEDDGDGDGDGPGRPGPRRRPSRRLVVGLRRRLKLPPP